MRRGRDRGGGLRLGGLGGGRVADGVLGGRGRLVGGVLAVDPLEAGHLHAVETTVRRDRGRGGGDQVVVVHQVVLAVGEEAALVLGGVARDHALHEQHPEHGAVAQVDRHGAVGRDAATGHREGAVRVERAERGVRRHVAGRGEGAGGGGGAGLRVGAAGGDEGEGQNEALHASLQGGVPVSRVAGLRRCPGIRGLEGRRELRRSKTRTHTISHDVKGYQKYAEKSIFNEQKITSDGSGVIFGLILLLQQSLRTLLGAFLQPGQESCGRWRYWTP